MDLQREWCAWGDESVRSAGVAQPLYLLGAAIVDPERCEGMRERLQALPRSGPKLHWRDAGAQDRVAIHRTVAAARVRHVVVIASPANPRRPERARAKCMERMLFELDRRGVSRFIMESRTASLNARDLTLIERLRGSHRIPATIRLEFALPSTEAMLWLPDQVLGMIGDAEAGRRQWYSADFAARVTRIDISLV